MSEPRKKLTYEVMKETKEVPQKLLDKLKEDNKIKGAITTALRSGPKTIPEIAKETGYPKHKVVWWLMTLRKYGSVIELEEVGEDGYYKYRLV